MNWPDDYINKIITGDCLEVMPGIPDGAVDCVITDPPYNSHTHKNAKTTTGLKKFGVCFSEIDNYDFLGILLAKSKYWIAVFCPIESVGIIKSENENNYVRGMIWDRIVNTPQISGDRPSQACEGIALLHSTRKKMKWN